MFVVFTASWSTDFANARERPTSPAHLRRRLRGAGCSTMTQIWHAGPPRTVRVRGGGEPDGICVHRTGQLTDKPTRAWHADTPVRSTAHDVSPTNRTPVSVWPRRAGSTHTPPTRSATAPMTEPDSRRPTTAIMNNGGTPLFFFFDDQHNTNINNGRRQHHRQYRPFSCLFFVALLYLVLGDLAFLIVLVNSGAGRRSSWFTVYLPVLGGHKLRYTKYVTSLQLP